MVATPSDKMVRKVQVLASTHYLLRSTAFLSRVGPDL